MKDIIQAIAKLNFREAALYIVEELNYLKNIIKSEEEQDEN